jgi:iron-sulfur cluster assembly accessory protein
MTEATKHGVVLTETAVTKVKTLLAAEGRDDLRLRVSVQPGGCSGLIYQLFFDEQLEEADAIVDFDGVEVVVDPMSVPYLDGASIDFEDSIQKQGFTIDNPNAANSCACGDSFS